MLEIHLEPKRNTEGGQTSGGGDFAFDALFTYDALGRRLSKDAIGITCWLWNGNVPLHEWTPSQRRNEQGEIEEYQKTSGHGYLRKRVSCPWLCSRTARHTPS